MKATAPGWNSCVYEGTVRHERFHPRQHSFSYRVFYLAIDLDELPRLAERSGPLAVNRRGLIAFWERDYFAGDSSSPAKSGPTSVRTSSCGCLKERIDDWRRDRGLPHDPLGRIILVSMPRILGYLFNPVSFYLCFDRTGQPLGAIAEVANTFGEAKLFPISVQTGGGKSFFQVRAPKYFYVSPFTDLDGVFEFLLHHPGAHLSFAVDEFEKGKRHLHSTLVGRRRPLSRSVLRWLLLRHPAMTLKVTAMIHWEAARLWAKRVPFFRKATRVDLQRDLHRGSSKIGETFS